MFVGGAAIQWLRDGARLIREADEINTLAASVADNGGVYFVPALSGMGAPYWDQYARGSFFGITRGTSNGHLARAVLEGIAFQVYDIVKAMEADAGQATAQLRVDGGASQSDYLMQVQSDLFAFDIVRPRITENHRPRRGLSGRAGGGLLAEHRRIAGAMAGGSKCFRRSCRPSACRKCCTTGIKRCRRRSIGLMIEDQSKAVFGLVDLVLLRHI